MGWRVCFLTQLCGPLIEFLAWWCVWAVYYLTSIAAVYGSLYTYFVCSCFFSRAELCFCTPGNIYGRYYCVDVTCFRSPGRTAWDPPFQKRNTYPRDSHLKANLPSPTVTVLFVSGKIGRPSCGWFVRRFWFPSKRIQICVATVRFAANALCLAGVALCSICWSTNPEALRILTRRNERERQEKAFIRG